MLDDCQHCRILLLIRHISEAAQNTCQYGCMYFFTVGESPVPFYLFSCLAQFFFSGFNTAIYAIVPDCVEYGEWKTGLRNDGFQYAFISLGNKIGMAIGTSVLAGVLGSFGYVANQQQNTLGREICRGKLKKVENLEMSTVGRGIWQEN